MKFKSDLGHYENLKAWREHSKNNPRSQYESLNDSEKSWLRHLNETLRQIEEKYSAVMAPKYEELKARVADPLDWLQEFNFDFAITYYLRDDDPEYEEDDDNILIAVEYLFLGVGSSAGFGNTADINFAEGPERFSGEWHCYLYHELYDHLGLDWRDLLRIGSLYVDIKIEEQSGILPIAVL